MGDAVKAFFRQPYWISALLIGGALVALPILSVDKDRALSTHAPTSLWPLGVGIGLILVSAIAFCVHALEKPRSLADVGAGLDMRRVKEANGSVYTIIGSCEVRVVEGRIETYEPVAASVVVLPCNEYFDDQCVGDKKSALGAYVNRVFEGQTNKFMDLCRRECSKRLGAGTEYQKTDDVRATSFGAGRCVLLIEPLGRSVSIALLSTTTQRAGEGLSARVSYLFGGIAELVLRLADTRFEEVVMPLMGAGHGRVDPPHALVGLILALGEALRHHQAGRRLKRVTIVVFRNSPEEPAQVDRTVARRALALVGSPV